jgi:hypothetical protein
MAELPVRFLGHSVPAPSVVTPFACGALSRELLISKNVSERCTDT